MLLSELQKDISELSFSKHLVKDLYIVGAGVGTKQPIKCTNIIKSELNTVSNNTLNLVRG